MQKCRYKSMRKDKPLYPKQRHAFHSTTAKVATYCAHSTQSRVSNGAVEKPAAAAVEHQNHQVPKLPQSALFRSVSSCKWSHVKETKILTKHLQHSTTRNLKNLSLALAISTSSWRISSSTKPHRQCRRRHLSPTTQLSTNVPCTWPSSSTLQSAAGISVRASVRATTCSASRTWLSSA
jgi:hypothetical protein